MTFKDIFLKKCPPPKLKRDHKLVFNAMVKQDQLKETLLSLNINCCSESCSYQLTEVPAALSTLTTPGAQEFQVVNWAEVIQRMVWEIPFSLLLLQGHKLNLAIMGAQHFPCGWLLRHLRNTDLSPDLAFDYGYINRNLFPIAGFR